MPRRHSRGRSTRATPTPAAIRSGSRRSRAAIASQLGRPAEEIELTRLAGSLHDLGKLAIPEEILRKPSALTEAERLVLERHPQIGYRMLESLGVEPIADWVLHHHERWDGTGYPDGLEGEAIPIGARIIFVADAFDAMTSNRLYRTPLTHEEALHEVERCSGSQFDPDVVQAFLAAVGAREPVAYELASGTRSLRRSPLSFRDTLFCLAPGHVLLRRRRIRHQPRRSRHSPTRFCD